MQTSLRRIAKKAKEDPKYKFGNLYGMLNFSNLYDCFGKMNRKAAPGVDQQNYYDFMVDLDDNVKELVEQLKHKSYKAKLIRRVHIPKDDGKTRALGLPVVADKLLQTAVAEILSAIYEKDFLDCSHGYRRGRGPKQCALELQERIHKGHVQYVVDADIKGFFDNIDHEWMLRMLAERINDKALLGLIRKWLKAGVLEEDGKVTSPLTGTPQGGVISAVLANIYLHYALDLWFEKRVKHYSRGFAFMMRYADDFVCCFKYKSDADAFYLHLRGRLSQFGLTLSEEKSKLIRFSRFDLVDNESFTFLGFEFRWKLSRNGKSTLTATTAIKKFRSSLKSITMWIRGARSNGITKIMKKLKQKLQGHFNYYAVIGNSDLVWKYRFEVHKIVFKWLNRRSQRKSYNWEGYREMIAHFKMPVPEI